MWTLRPVTSAQAERHENIVLLLTVRTAGGLEDGDYMLGEFPVVVADGTARLKSTGNLAGFHPQAHDGD